MVLSYRGVRLNRGMLTVGLLAALVGIPAIEAFRNVGFANRDSVDWTDVTPVDTLTELGGSLQATMAFVDWIEKGDPYLLGTTYWAPFDRQILTRLIPGREPIPWEDDETLASATDGRARGADRRVRQWRGLLQFRPHRSVCGSGIRGCVVRMAGDARQEERVGLREPWGGHVRLLLPHPR